uniref:Uncharacterized protein n=1 Tax=Muribaculaceae bacterium Z82 TaxID=2304548 RepID=A0A7C9NM88_9BACT
MHKDFEVVADPFGEEAVTEPMTGLYWNPQNPRGYQAQWNRGVEPERIALTSYGAFGSNYRVIAPGPTGSRSTLARRKTRKEKQ